MLATVEIVFSPIMPRKLESNKKKEQIAMQQKKTVKLNNVTYYNEVNVALDGFKHKSNNKTQ